MKKLVHKLFFDYQKIMWYTNVFAGEYAKPGKFINETLLITTALAVRGIRPSFFIIVVAYISILVLAAVIGKILVFIGVVDYNNRLGNKTNPEIMEILERIKNIESKLK